MPIRSPPRQSASRVWHHTRYAGQSILQSVSMPGFAQFHLLRLRENGICSFNNNEVFMFRTQKFPGQQHVIH